MKHRITYKGATYKNSGGVPIKSIETLYAPIEATITNQVYFFNVRIYNDGECIKNQNFLNLKKAKKFVKDAIDFYKWGE